MIYTTRPLSDRTWLRPDAQRKTSQFDATWTKTLTLLGREIEHLGGRDVVIEVDVREQDIKLDGMLRANARASSPAVVVAFDTREHGPMLYRADRYGDRSRLGSVSVGPDKWPLTAHHAKARARSHPDRNGGDRTLWDQVEQAAQVLGVAR